MRVHYPVDTLGQVQTVSCRISHLPHVIEHSERSLVAFLGALHLAGPTLTKSLYQSRAILYIKIMESNGYASREPCISIRSGFQ